MRKVAIGFSKPKGFAPLAWLIRLFDRRDFTHTYVDFFSESFQRKLIYQAKGTMIHFTGAQYFGEHNTEIKRFEFEMEDADFNKMMQWCIDRAGRPYGCLNFIGIGLVKIVYWIFGLRIHNPFADGDFTMPCSELSSFVLKNFMHCTEVRDMEVATPGDVYDWCVLVQQRVKSRGRV